MLRTAVDSKYLLDGLTVKHREVTSSVILKIFPSLPCTFSAQINKTLDGSMPAKNDMYRVNGQYFN